MSSPLCSGDSQRFLGFPNTPSCFGFLPSAHSLPARPSSLPHPSLPVPTKSARVFILRHFPQQSPFPQSLGSSRDRLHAPAPRCMRPRTLPRAQLRPLAAREPLRCDCLYESPGLGAPEGKAWASSPAAVGSLLSVPHCPRHRIHGLGATAAETALAQTSLP